MVDICKCGHSETDHTVEQHGTTFDISCDKCKLVCGRMDNNEIVTSFIDIYG